jgi:hypothetical protein
MPLRQHTNSSSTLNMANMNLGSSMRWISASTMMLWHHSQSTSDLISQIWGKLASGMVCVHAYGLDLEMIMWDSTNWSAFFTFTFSLWIGHIWTITWRGCVHLHLESCTNEIREVAMNLIALNSLVLRVPAMTWHAAWNTLQQNICSIWGCETQTQKQLNPSMIPHVVCCKGGHQRRNGLSTKNCN